MAPNPVSGNLNLRLPARPIGVLAQRPLRGCVMKTIVMVVTPFRDRSFTAAVRVRCFLGPVLRTANNGQRAVPLPRALSGQAQTDWSRKTRSSNRGPLGVRMPTPTPYGMFSRQSRCIHGPFLHGLKGHPRTDGLIQRICLWALGVGTMLLGRHGRRPRVLLRGGWRESLRAGRSFDHPAELRAVGFVFFASGW